MIKIVVYQYDKHRRDAAAHTLRAAGYTAYAAANPNAAYEAVQNLKPNLVLTDFPALLSGLNADRHTLTEAIRSNPELSQITVLNFPSVWSRELEELALVAGVNGTITRAPTPQHILEAVHRWCSRELPT